MSKYKSATGRPARRSFPVVVTAENVGLVIRELVPSDLLKYKPEPKEQRN